MKTEDFSNMYRMTHDLTCAFTDLSITAVGYAQPLILSSDQSVSSRLAVAAVAFTIQLAIDVTGRDPIEMRKLEAELLSKLEASP